jgi:hypothetical protein
MYDMKVASIFNCAMLGRHLMIKLCTRSKWYICNEHKTKKRGRKKAAEEKPRVCQLLLLLVLHIM